jgi:hypothetical protein
MTGSLSSRGLEPWHTNLAGPLRTTPPTFMLMVLLWPMAHVPESCTEPLMPLAPGDRAPTVAMAAWILGTSSPVPLHVTCMRPEKFQYTLLVPVLPSAFNWESLSKDVILCGAYLLTMLRSKSNAGRDKRNVNLLQAASHVISLTAIIVCGRFRERVLTP